MTGGDPITRLNAALEGRYRIERELGEGGMATVYFADDIKHERKVALKVLKPVILTSFRTGFSGFSCRAWSGWLHGPTASCSARRPETTRRAHRPFVHRTMTPQPAIPPPYRMGASLVDR